MCRCATLWHIWHSCWLAVASSCFLCHPVYLLLVVWILSSKESSSNADGSKSVGNSLHRSTSLSLTTLPHRSKSFQAKLHFGDMNDDIHVGVQCLRAIMNNQVHASPSFLVCTTSRCRTAYILLLWFFLSSFFFRRLISEVTARISTKLGHIFTYDCYWAFTPMGWWQKAAFLAPTLKFDRTYLCNGT